MADITKIKPLGSTTEYTLNARILGQTSSTTATDKGGLTWNNISGKLGTTINAYDTPSTTDTWWYILRNRHTNTGNNYYTDVAIPFNANSIYYKRVTGNTGSETIANASTNNGWVLVLDLLNYNNYAPTKEGVGASGTWDINITGTAAKATNDSDGNAINTTYLKKSGGTMTGNINRYYSAASTDPMITALANNLDIILFTVGHGGGAQATTTSNHYKLLYKGTNSSPNNYLQLIAHGSADKVAILIDENANVSFTNKITANISGNAETVTVTKTTPTSTTTYYPVYTTSTTTGALSLRNDTRFYYYDTGTTSYLNIGNTSNSGGLTLHNANGNYGDIISSAFTDKRTFTLPDKTGTFALTSDLNSYLPLTGGTLTGPLYVNSLSKTNYIAIPDNGFWSADGSKTGAIKITLPVSWTATMMSMKVDIYNYDNDNAITYTIGGYNYTGSDGYWTNCSASSTGLGNKANLTVRFGHDGTKCCIIIGETNTSWSYPKAQVRDIMIGHSGTTLENWTTGWTVSLITTLPDNIDITKSNPAIIPIIHGGTGASTAAAARANLGTWSLISDSYNTLMPADGSTNGWVKIGTSNTSYGLLPSTSGGAGSGHNYIGTSSWYWKYAYIDEIHGALKGNANTATKANITTTAGAVAYYSDTTGTFANDADFLWDATDNKLTAAKLNGYVMAGLKAGTTLGSKATAEGNNNTASGDYSHAEGNSTKASGSGSHAEGGSTTASKSYSHAEGYDTAATGPYAHAEGYTTTATVDGAHAEGGYTTASNYWAHAEGYGTIASGYYSHAEGQVTTAQRRSLHVFGEFNILDTTGSTSTRGSYIEIVGNGANAGSRSNARTLDWDGNESLAGNLLPMVTNTKTLGDSNYKWADAYITTTHGDLDGNADTATKWETARTLTIGYKGQTVDGSADVTWDLHDILKTNTNISTATSWDLTTPGVYYVSSSAAYTGTSNPESNTKDGTAGLYRYGLLIVSRAANGGLALFYIAHNDSADNNKYGIHFRTGWNGNYLAKWRQLIDSGNYTNWTVTKTGDGASGEWAISITGNAATATAISTTGGTTAKFWRGDNTWSSELTDKLTVKYLTISSTEANEHLKFSRADNPNYIIAPLTSNSLSGSIAIGSSTSLRSFRITKDDISPYDATATATSRLGTLALPWKELFILAHSSSANANGIQFSDKTNVKGRLGVNTSGGVGLYGADSIYIRPSLTASDIGLIIKTDKTVVPGADSSHSLGSTSLHWLHGYYDDLFVSTNTTYTATNSAVAGTAITTGYLDLTNTSPAIRLHRASAAAITGQITSDANAGLHLTGTAATTATVYNDRSILPLVKIDGSTFATAAIETGTYFMNSTNGGSNTGYYLRGHNVDYGRLYISTIGTAAVGTTTTDPDTGESTTTYTNTVGEAILSLGNSLLGTSGNSNSVANNARGRVRLYGAGTKYIDLYPNISGTSGNYTHYLPGVTGYVGVESSPIKTMDGWTPANWNRYNGYYIPLINNSGIEYQTDVFRPRVRLYSAASSTGYSVLDLGNNIPSGTAGNAYGGLRIYGKKQYYTDVIAQDNTANHICYLPNYAGNTYLAHTANNNAVGNSNTPVYVAENGRLTACSSLGLPYGATLPSSGTEGDIYLQISAEYYELPTGGAIGQVLAKKTAADRSVEWINLPVTGINVSSSSSKFYPIGTTSSSNGTINTAAFNSAVYVENNVLFGAAWNDYAEFRQPIQELSPTPGMCVVETGDDTLEISTKRMLPGAAIVSDTYGFAIGKQDKAICPIAVSGRVLAYPYEDREEFKKNIGRPVCAGPNGTVSIMTDEEYRNYGYCAIGTISAVPNYETWGENNIPVNNRVWIKVR